jgi:hypothetical protein
MRDDDSAGSERRCCHRCGRRPQSGAEIQCDAGGLGSQWQGPSHDSPGFGSSDGHRSRRTAQSRIEVRWHARGLGDPSFGLNTIPASLTNVVAIAADYFLNAALEADGTVVAWGLNNAGQTTVPAAVNKVKAIDAANSHSVALLAADPVIGSTPIQIWRNNHFGITTDTGVAADMAHFDNDGIADNHNGTRGGDRTPDQLGVNEPLYR